MSTAPSFNERIATFRVKPSLPDHRDFWAFATVPAGTLPANLDLGVAVPIKDQGRQGSCTGHGYSSMTEALEALHGAPRTDLARAYIYARERIMEHDLNQDAGAMPIDGCKVLKTYGVCAETDMPYSDQTFNAAPTTAEDKAAAAHKISGYVRVAGSLATRQQTALKRPVGFGIAVYESFENIGADGVMPMPKAGEQMLGGHWVFGNAKGYVTDASLPGGGGFWAQNSWGPGWGKNGYMLMPWAYIDNPAFTFEIRAIYR